MCGLLWLPRLPLEFRRQYLQDCSMLEIVVAVTVSFVKHGFAMTLGNSPLFHISHRELDSEGSDNARNTQDEDMLSKLSNLRSVYIWKFSFTCAHALSSNPLLACWLNASVGPSTKIFNFNPSMDKQLHISKSVRWNYFFIPKLQRCNRWSMGMDK